MADVNESMFTAHGQREDKFLPFNTEYESNEKKLGRLLDELREARGKKRVCQAKDAVVEFFQDRLDDLRDDLRDW